MKAVIARLLILTGMCWGAPFSIYAATCSCAGVPLLTSINTSASEQGQLFINYTTENHQISDLVSGTNKFRDGTRRDRHSVSQIISASYAVTDRWSVSGLVSYVEHSRKIGSSFLGSTHSSGQGDSVLLVRYTPLFITPFSRHELSVGIGARLPTGEDDFGSSFRFSEDMQPSVGASGKILWSSYSYAFNQAATLQFNTSANYLSNAENQRDYSFGDEFNVAFGVSQSIGSKFGYSAALRYRSSQADERFGFEVPNTGGEWLDFVPAVQYAITDSLDVGLVGRIPLARDLNGALQFTTSYSYGLSLTYGF